MINNSKIGFAMMPYIAMALSASVGTLAGVLAYILYNAWQVYDGYGSLVFIEILYWITLTLLLVEVLVYGLSILLSSRQHQSTVYWIKTHYSYQNTILIYSIVAKVILFGVLLIMGQPLSFESLPLVTDTSGASYGPLSGLIVNVLGTWGFITGKVPNEGLTALAGTWAIIAGFATSFWIVNTIRLAMNALLLRESVLR